MRWVAVLLLVSCAHASHQPTQKPPPQEPPREEPEKPPPPPDDRTPCSTEPALPPIPASELKQLRKDDHITLHRGACFGMCPSYSVTVFGDGRVEAMGERYVQHSGALSWRIDEAAAKRLLAELVRLHVWALEPKLSVAITDLPTARLEGKLGKHTVSVRHYGAGAEQRMKFGNRDGETATRLEHLIDQVSEAETRIVGCAAKL